MVNKALIFLGVLLLSLQGKSHEAPIANVLDIRESERIKEFLILQTNGPDRELLKKVLLNTELSVLSNEEQVRLIRILNTLEQGMQTQSKPWVISH